MKDQTELFPQPADLGDLENLAASGQHGDTWGHVTLARLTVTLSDMETGDHHGPAGTFSPPPSQVRVAASLGPRQQIITPDFYILTDLTAD